MKDKVVAVLSNGAAGFHQIIATMPEERAADVAEALRQLRRDRMAHKLAGTWRLGVRPKAEMRRH